uniref:Uncharacterized protein n=1 Tax=Steinernema glaseri TaxID=37863 RepID=A0A1I7Y2S2_9BILA
MSFRRPSFQLGLCRSANFCLDEDFRPKRWRKAQRSGTEENTSSSETTIVTPLRRDSGAVGWPFIYSPASKSNRMLAINTSRLDLPGEREKRRGGVMGKHEASAGKRVSKISFIFTYPLNTGFIWIDDLEDNLEQRAEMVRQTGY